MMTQYYRPILELDWSRRVASVGVTVFINPDLQIPIEPAVTNEAGETIRPIRVENYSSTQKLREHRTTITFH